MTKNEARLLLPGVEDIQKVVRDRGGRMPLDDAEAVLDFLVNFISDEDEEDNEE